MKQIVILLLVVIIATVSVIAEESSGSSVANVNDSVSGRKKHRFPNAIWYHGLRALSAVLAIKIKIILVLAFFGSLAWFGFRYWSGHGLGCGFGEIYKEGPIIPYEHSISPYEHHSSHEIISSYPGPEPYSSGYSSYATGHDSGSSPPTGPYKRVSKVSRAMESDWSDLAFTFLGVNSEPCKKRFICEFDFKAKSNPIMGLAYSYISGTYLQKYRAIEDEVPKSVRDCNRIYSQCRMPGEKTYEEQNNEAGEVFDEEKNEINTTLLASEEDDKTTTEPIGRLILKRSMKSNN